MLTENIKEMFANTIKCAMRVKLPHGQRTFSYNFREQTIVSFLYTSRFFFFIFFFIADGCHISCT